MSEITEIIDSLENRIKKLIDKIDSLEKNSNELKAELEKVNSVNSNQTNEIKDLKSVCETLKMTNSLLGSDENKRETKLKINSLIREIDYCIAQLSD